MPSQISFGVINTFSLLVITLILYYFLPMKNSRVRKWSWSCWLPSPSQWEHPRFCPKLVDPDGSHRWVYLMLVFLHEYFCFWMKAACSSHSILSNICCVHLYFSLSNLAVSWNPQWERISFGCCWECRSSKGRLPWGCFGCGSISGCLYFWR